MAPQATSNTGNSTTTTTVLQLLLLLLLSMQKTSQFKTQCKGDISHAFETAQITVFYPTVCKTPDVPLQNELLCWTLNFIG